MTATTTADAQRAAFSAVSVAFGSLGRVCLALDERLQILQVSGALDALLGPGAAAAWAGRPVEALLGQELLGPAGPLRQALLAGERREGWRAWLPVAPSGTRLCSVSAAPLRHEPGDACGPEAAYLVVLRPSDDDEATRGSAPTAFGGLIARSHAMTRVLRLVQGLEHSEATVLLSGESGTGKGLLAQAIHDHSPRRRGPFVAVNCAALPDALLETELFGHVRGAFTGAVRDRVGRFELAAGGTLFLDEVGDLPLHLQAKLLRALQERTFERVGESHPVTADVRIIAATHRDLRRAVEEKRFREDLYYRLRVFPIDIPPLRVRREDVEPLARYLLARVGARSGRALRFSPEALKALLDHHWPGNVRELENALEYAVTVATGQTLQPEDLPPEVTIRAPEARPEHARGRAEPPAGTTRAAVPAGYPASPAWADDTPLPGLGAGAVTRPSSGPDRPRGEPPTREALASALADSRWRMAQAAASLGVSRTTLWRWMRELGLSR
ncbi:MAG: sigma 54-interacting transcriptional regulator [Anaeromyxobacter sp.]|nr:sigma 54-interacting transcriptional regulator [Anaeromyxobacter sp.]